MGRENVFKIASLKDCIWSSYCVWLGQYTDWWSKYDLNGKAKRNLSFVSERIYFRWGGWSEIVTISLGLMGDGEVKSTFFHAVIAVLQNLILLYDMDSSEDYMQIRAFHVFNWKIKTARFPWWNISAAVWELKSFLEKPSTKMTDATRSRSSVSTFVTLYLKTCGISVQKYAFWNYRSALFKVVH